MAEKTTLTLDEFVLAVADALHGNISMEHVPRLAESKPNLPVLKLLPSGQRVTPDDIHGNIVRFVVDAETEQETAFVVEVTQLRKGAHYAPYPPLPPYRTGAEPVSPEDLTVRFPADGGPQLWFGDGHRAIRMDRPGDAGDLSDFDRRDLRIMRALLDTATEAVDGALRRGLTG